MSNELDPLVGQWYSHEDKGQRFFVTAVDADKGTVEVQHFDGDIEEFSLDDWAELDIDLSEEPENWAGALEVAEQDDRGTEVTDTSAEDWEEPGKDFHPSGRERQTGEGRDRSGEGYIDEDPLE